MTVQCKTIKKLTTFTGFLVTFLPCQPLTRPQQYSDASWWDQPEEEDADTLSLDVDLPKLFTVQVGHGEAGRRQSLVRNGV